MYEMVVTTAGLGLLASLGTGTALEITQCMVGTGSVDSREEAMLLTDMVASAALCTSTTPIQTDNECTFSIEYRNDLNGGQTKDLTISEFGVWAQTEDYDETLLIYGCLSDSPKEISAIADTGVIEVLRFPVTIQVNNDCEVTLAYSALAFMTSEDVTAYCTSVILPLFVSNAEELIAAAIEAHNTDESAHQNLWIPGCFYATCETSASTAAKTATCDELLNRKVGTLVRCIFTYAQSSSTESTLNVADTGENSIITIDGEYASWSAGDDLLLQYDGSNWILLFNLSEGSSNYYFGYCDTAADEAAKTVDIDNFRLKTSTCVIVNFIYANTASNMTLNVSETGALAVYSNASRVAPGLFKDGALLMLQYDGTAWNLIGDWDVADGSNYGRVKLTTDLDDTMDESSGYALAPAALANYCAFVYQDDEPDNTNLLWINSSGVMRFYDGDEWSYIVPVWG